MSRKGVNKTERVLVGVLGGNFQHFSCVGWGEDTQQWGGPPSKNNGPLRLKGWVWHTHTGLSRISEGLGVVTRLLLHYRNIIVPCLWRMKRLKSGWFCSFFLIFRIIISLRIGHSFFFCRRFEAKLHFNASPSSIEIILTKMQFGPYACINFATNHRWLTAAFRRNELKPWRNAINPHLLLDSGTFPLPGINHAVVLPQQQQHRAPRVYI